jgi:hypothetical protein
MTPRNYSKLQIVVVPGTKSIGRTKPAFYSSISTATATHHYRANKSRLQKAIADGDFDYPLALISNGPLHGEPNFSSN